MGWDGKRRKPAKPLTVDHCCCSECGGVCPDEPGKGIARCEPCHYGERHGTGADEYLSWHCAAAGHHDDLCASRDEHKAKLAAEVKATKRMLRSLDHAIEVGGERQWGQLTFEDIA